MPEVLVYTAKMLDIQETVVVEKATDEAEEVGVVV